MVDDAAGLAFIVNLGCLELHPHAVRGRRSRPPRRAARRSRSRAGRRLGRRAARGAGGESAARGAGSARVAQDQRLTRDARQRADSSALELRRRPPRGAGAVARDRAARADDRHLEVVEGGAPRRLPRLQPERQGPDHLLGLFDPPAPRRARLGAARLERGRRLQSRRLHGGDDAGALRRAPRSPRRDGRRRRDLEKLLELAARDDAAGLGDAPWPPHFRKSEGEAPRVAPSRARGAAKAATATARPPRRARAPRRCRSSPWPTRPTRTRRWRGSNAGRPSTPKRRSAGRRRRADRCDARPLVDLDPHPDQPAPRPRGDPPAARDARPRRRSDARVAPAVGRGAQAREAKGPYRCAGRRSATGGAPHSKRRSAGRARCVVTVVTMVPGNSRLRLGGRGAGDRHRREAARRGARRGFGQQRRVEARGRCDRQPAAASAAARRGRRGPAPAHPCANRPGPTSAPTGTPGAGAMRRRLGRQNRQRQHPAQTRTASRWRRRPPQLCSNACRRRL